MYVLREDRPALLVSSTSWTVDEDFGVLLDALHKYDRAKTKEANLPALVCVITGKGPEKASYMRRIEEMRMRHVQASRALVVVDRRSAGGVRVAVVGGLRARAEKRRRGRVLAHVDVGCRPADEDSRHVRLSSACTFVR